MENLKVINKSTFLGKEIDVYGTVENPLFLAKDVAEWIEHSDAHKLVEMVDDDEKVRNIVPTLGGNQEMWLLTEDGLYEVLMLSRKPIAKQFKKGVKEILKSIRNTGGYMVMGENESEEDLMARALVVAKATLKRREERIKALEQETANKDGEIKQLSATITEMQPKVSYVDTILACKDTVTTTQIAQDYGISAKAFNILLRNYDVQRKVGGQWILYAKYLPHGYVQSETVSVQTKNGTNKSVMHTKWTQKGRLFLYDFLKQRNVLPKIEQ